MFTIWSSCWTHHNFCGTMENSKDATMESIQATQFLVVCIVMQMAHVKFLKECYIGLVYIHYSLNESCQHFVSVMFATLLAWVGDSVKSNRNVNDLIISRAMPVFFTLYFFCREFLSRRLCSILWMPGVWCSCLSYLLTRRGNVWAERFFGGLGSW